MTANAEPPQHHPRIKVNQPAVLRNGDATGMDCTIIDVSQEGFRIAITRGLACGAHYTLEYEHEAHPVDIRWSASGEAGGLFLDAKPSA